MPIPHVDVVTCRRESGYVCRRAVVGLGRMEETSRNGEVVAADGLSGASRARSGMVDTENLDEVAAGIVTQVRDTGELAVPSRPDDDQADGRRKVGAGDAVSFAMFFVNGSRRSSSIS